MNIKLSDNESLWRPFDLKINLGHSDPYFSHFALYLEEYLIDEDQTFR